MIIDESLLSGDIDLVIRHFIHDLDADNGRRETTDRNEAHGSYVCARFTYDGNEVIVPLKHL